MYIIVGLGNPEPEYSRTRHNMGFQTINHITEKKHITVNKEKFQGMYGTGMIGEEKVILVKPQTYMNLSGDCLIQFCQFYKIQPNKLIVIYDDMDIPVGKIKIRKQGSAGSHNGMKSVISRLGTEEFIRIRIGIGRPEQAYETIHYVIGSVPEEEWKQLDIATKKAAEAVEMILTKGLDQAMNQYN